MSDAFGIAPSSLQSSAAVVGYTSTAKPQTQSRDDVVAPIETTNTQASRVDISLLKMTNPSLGQNVNFTV